MHPKMKLVFVGVDTHKRTHTACIINCFGEKLAEITFDNRPGAFEEFLEFVKGHTKRGISPVFGLEDTNSAGRALTVFLINAKKKVKKVDSSFTFNERRSQPIINKTDSVDSFCIARVLLNRLDELPDAQVTDIYWTLGMLVGRRNAIVKSSTALKNQIHANIAHHYPSYKKFFNVFDCKSALEFWEKYPSPSKLKGTSVEQLAELLHLHSSGFFGREKAEEILSLVEKDGDTSTEYQESRDFMVVTCIKELKHNNLEIAKIEQEMRNIMARLGYKLETMIGVELVVAAGLVAEIGDIGRFATPDKLAKYAGIAPVKFSSGDKDRTLNSRQGNRQLYGLFHALAARSVNMGRNSNKPVNDVLYEYYQRKMSQGKTRHQAIKCVMRRLCNIVYGLMKNKTEYIHPVLPKKDAG